MQQLRISVKVKDLFQHYNNGNGKLNMNPRYQRDYIAKDKLKWQQHLIRNIVSAEMVIPNLYVRALDYEAFLMEIFNGDHIVKPELIEKRAKALWESVREMIDGQQRSRTIIDFINDKFRTSDNTTVKITSL